MMKKEFFKRHSLLFLCLSLLLGVVFFSNPTVGNAASDSTKTCESYQVPVSLTPGGPESSHISGTLCSMGSPEGKTLQVLIHGFTLTHSYWDFRYQPKNYSYVNAFIKEGYATFNIDRIGVTNSSHPPAAAVTVYSNAYVVHQVVQKLRSGELTGTPFSKVMAVGHSLGSIISVVEAGSYKEDFDGIVLTGFLHPLNPLKTGLAILSTVPAQKDPKFADGGYPLGYVSLLKQDRDIFYNPEDTDPNIYEVDNETKGTGTLTELATVEDALLPTLSAQINVPILVAVGEKDEIFCNGLLSPCTSRSVLLAREKLFYLSAPSLEAFVLPNAGHNMNYELNAKALYQEITDWSDRHIGP